MTSDFEPEEMLVYASKVASEMLEAMPDEEAVVMVRDFVNVMAKWQPEAYSKLNNDPTLVALTALSTATLFQKAFIKAYAYSERHVAAREAVEKALGDQS